VRVVGWDEFLGSYTPERALAGAVGVFDGLHLGHRELIGRVLGKTDLASAVITFKESPKRILRPSSFHGDLSTLDLKLESLAALGLYLCVLIDFSGDFSKLAGRKFLSLLRERGDLRFLALGPDFRCGHKLDTDAQAIGEYYRREGVETEIVRPVLWAGHPVSSSRIRRAVAEGRLEDAAAMLGRPYEIDLRRLARSAGGVREAGSAQISPPAGRYAALARLGDGSGCEVEAALEEGRWIGLPEGAATLGLLRSVSRE
jgi:riboflavin kinase/FMN adenylyltransferase